MCADEVFKEWEKISKKYNCDINIACLLWLEGSFDVGFIKDITTKKLVDKDNKQSLSKTTKLLLRSNQRFNSCL